MAEQKKKKKKKKKKKWGHDKLLRTFCQQSKKKERKKSKRKEAVPLAINAKVAEDLFDRETLKIYL